MESVALAGPERVAVFLTSPVCVCAGIMVYAHPNFEILVLNYAGLRNKIVFPLKL